MDLSKHGSFIVAHTFETGCGAQHLAELLFLMMAAGDWRVCGQVRACAYACDRHGLTAPLPEDRTSPARERTNVKMAT